MDNKTNKPTYEQLEALAAEQDALLLSYAKIAGNNAAKVQQLAVDNAYLLNGAARELNTSWMLHKTMLGAQAALVCVARGDIKSARDWLEGATDEAVADIPDEITVAELQAWFDSKMVSSSGKSGFLTRQQAEEAIRAACPATDAYLSQLRNEALKDHADKRGFSFQHGSIHAHFGNGDVLVGATKFEGGEAGICFAPVREKDGGVGTEYKWTKGKNTEQVGALFVISSSSVAGLEVIQKKLSEAIELLREGKAGEVQS